MIKVDKLSDQAVSVEFNGYQEEGCINRAAPISVIIDFSNFAKMIRFIRSNKIDTFRIDVMNKWGLTFTKPNPGKVKITRAVLKARKNFHNVYVDDQSLIMLADLLEQMIQEFIGTRNTF